MTASTTVTSRPDDERLKRLWRKSCEIGAARRAIPDDLAHDHVLDALGERENVLFEEMIATPATGIVGVALKLRAAATFGGFGPGLPEDLVTSALQDAERLAGEEEE